MTYKIDKTFPDKLGDIIDISGLPFNHEAPSFKKRLKRTFEKIFKKNGVRDSKLGKDYWKILYDMISNPNETFGLVAIDGYVTDVMGDDDIALIFNMGIPRLRGRRVQKLDRIYARISRNNPDIKFYNSGIEGDEVYFDFRYKVPAWHPHISNAMPCLGSYGTELGKWRLEANPIMYLRTIHMFLNTWNRNSPYWDINHNTIDYNSDNKKYKASNLFNSLHLQGQDPSNYNRHFIVDNIDKIDSGSVQNDANVLAHILGKLKYVKESLGDNIREKVNKDHLNDIRHIHQYLRDRRENRRLSRNGLFSIMKERDTNIYVPSFYQDKTSISTIEISNGRLIEDENYSLASSILQALEEIMEDIYKYITRGSMYELVFEETDYAIRLYCQYYAPLLTKINKLCDEMTNSEGYNIRVYHDTGESSIVNKELSVEKRKLIAFSSKRWRRIMRMMHSYYDKMFSEKFVNEKIGKRISEAFEYTISDQTTRWDGVEYRYLIDKGRFWSRMYIDNIDDPKFRKLEKILSPKSPESLSDLLTLYEAIKKNLIEQESQYLIGQYNNVIRSLKDYGNQTNNTKEDTQQVHLSFE